VSLLQEAFEGVAEVLQEMEAVSDLCGIRRAACRAIRIAIATVPGDYPDTGGCAQPRGDGIGGTIRQEVNGSVPFEVAEDGAIAPPFRPCPVIDAERDRRRKDQQRGADTGCGLPARDDGRVGNILLAKSSRR